MRAQVLELIKRHGWNATAFQTLGQGFAYWFDGDDACVAYTDTGAAWVAAGAPLCAPSRLGEVARRFVDAARSEGRRASFFGVEQRFLDASGARSVPIGDQPVWSATQWEATVKGSSSLREQLRRARAKGVEIRAIEPGDARALEALASVRSAWEATRPMASMGFLVAPADLGWPAERRSWLAEVDGELVGFLHAAPVYARRGWLLEEFVRTHGAPNGTVELLIDTAMRAFADEGSEYVTMGLAPLSGDTPGWLKAVARAGAGLYDFEGLERFKARFKPLRWDALHLATLPGQSTLRALWDTLHAFARGGLLRFGIDTLLRVPDVVVRLLGALLFPWTALLAAADVTQWFPAPWVKWAWVGFDVVLGAALLSLARKWRQGLGLAVCVAVTCDAALTLWQAVAWNWPRRAGVLDVVMTLVACAAPTVAGLLLWRAWAVTKRPPE